MVRNLIYKNMYIGVPVFESDFKSVDLSVEEFHNVDLQRSLTSEYKRAYKDKSKFYEVIKGEKKDIQRKLKNPLTLFNRSRKELKKKVQTINEELKFERIELRNTKNAYSDSRSVIGEVQRKLRFLSTIMPSELNEIERLHFDITKMERFNSLEDIDTYYNDLLIESINEIKSELMHDPAYYNVDCDGVSLNEEYFNFEVEKSKNDLKELYKKKVLHNRKLFVQKEWNKKTYNSYLEKYAKEGITEGELINFCINGELAINYTLEKKEK